MNTNESTTEKALIVQENKTSEENAGNQLEVLQALSETFDSGENLPENLLINSAQRLSNLAHSLFEKHENEYLNGEEAIRTITSEKVEDICKLAEASSKQMMIALQFKKERVNAIKILSEVRK